MVHLIQKTKQQSPHTILITKSQKQQPHIAAATLVLQPNSNNTNNANVEIIEDAQREGDINIIDTDTIDSNTNNDNNNNNDGTPVTPPSIRPTSINDSTNNEQQQPTVPTAITTKLPSQMLDFPTVPSTTTTGTTTSTPPTTTADVDTDGKPDVSSPPPDPDSFSIDACICNPNNLDDIDTIIRTTTTTTILNNEHCDELELIQYEQLTICISTDNSDALSLYLQNVNSLNFTHVDSGTVFHVIHPVRRNENVNENGNGNLGMTTDASGRNLQTNTNDEDESKSYNADAAPVATSPWAQVRTNQDKTYMVIQVTPGGLRFWFEDYIGSEIIIEGRVQLLEKEGGGDRGEDEGGRLRRLNDDDKGGNTNHPVGTTTRRSLQQTSSTGGETIYKDFVLRTTIANPPTPAPSTSPSYKPFPWKLIHCICDMNDKCYNNNSNSNSNSNTDNYEDEFMVSKSKKKMRICLNIEQADDGGLSLGKIDRVTSLLITQQGGTGEASSSSNFVFEVISGDAISPLATIELDSENADMVISVKLLPIHFLEPAALLVSGLASVLSFTYSDNDRVGDDVGDDSAMAKPSIVETVQKQFELTVGMEGMPIIAPAGAPSTMPSITVSRPPLALRVCRCDNNNGGSSSSSSSSGSHNCLDGPLVMKGGDNNVNPELRLCIFVNDPRVDISLDSLEISQEETNALMKLISNGELSGSADVEYDGGGSSDGKLVITVPKVSVFFLSDGDTEGRLPAITVKGTATVGGDGDSTKDFLDFSVVIPLQVTVDGVVDGGGEYVVEVNGGLPSAFPSIHLSQLPSYTNSPSYPYAPSTHPSETVSAAPSVLPSTSGPTDQPSSSNRPSIEHEPSVVACICDPSRMGKAGNVCLDDNMFSEVENNLRLCLMTRPANVELVSGKGESYYDLHFFLFHLRINPINLNTIGGLIILH